jgi:capsular exopolysaccharide synthesis family protein
MSPNKLPPGSSGIEFAPLGLQSGGPPITSTGRAVDLVRFMISQWPRLLLGGVAGLVLGIAAYVYLGPSYDASTRILVSKRADTPLAESGQNRTFGDRAEHVHLIKSSVIVKRAIDEHELTKLPTLAGSDDPVEDLIDGLTVKRSAGQDQSFLNFFDISFESTSKTDGAEIVTAVVEAYDKYLAETRQVHNQEVLDLITRADVKLRRDIEQLEQEYQQFREDAPLLFPTPVGTATPGGQTVVQPNHYYAEVDRIRKDLSRNDQLRTDINAQIHVLHEMIEDGQSREAIEHYVLMALSRPATGPGESGGNSGATTLLAGPPAKERLDSQLLSEQLRETMLRQHLGNDHPEVRRTQRRIDTVIAAYRAEGLIPPSLGDLASDGTRGTANRSGVDLADIYDRYLRQQLLQLDFSDRSLHEQLATAMQEAKEASQYEITDRKYRDDLERLNALWNDIVLKLSRVDLTKEHAGFVMERISDVKVELSLKRILKIVGACTMLGALAMFAFRYLVELQDTTMRTLDEVRRVAEATVMGAVPRFVVTQHDRDRDESGLSPALCYFHRPGSREAEAYRSLRTTLFFSTAPHNDRVIQISSPEPGDGKTTSAANLAVSVAQSGKRVLLIDGDLRRPTLHELFGLPQHVGLADVLRHEIEWINAVRPTAVDQLSLLTAGDAPDNPAELLSTSDLGTMLKEARKEFDYVFIDTPPILAVSDPCIIAPQTDGMMLVIRMQKNKRPVVVRTRDILDAHGVQLYGIVANDFEASSVYGDDYNSYSTYYETGSKVRGPYVSQPLPLQPAYTDESFAT